MYADKELNSYTTMLATFTGYSKYDLQQQAETLFSDFTQVNLYVYLDKEKFKKVSNNTVKYVLKNNKQKIKNNGYKNMFNSIK